MFFSPINKLEGTLRVNSHDSEISLFLGFIQLMENLFECSVASFFPTLGMFVGFFLGFFKATLPSLHLIAHLFYEQIGHYCTTECSIYLSIHHQATSKRGENDLRIPDAPQETSTRA
jgi:hypothetical protein